MAKDVIMPVLGMNQDTAVLLAWLKNEGDQVQEGEPIMEVETDKATMELDAPASGTLANVTAGAGEEVRVGSTIAVILADGEAAPARAPGATSPGAGTAGDTSADTTPDATAGTATEPAPEPAAGAPAASTSPSKAGGTPPPAAAAAASAQAGVRTASGLVLASPKARRLAAENGVALAALEGLGSGPEGAVLAADVLHAAATGTAAGTAAAPSAADAALGTGAATSAPITVEREVDAAELVAMLAWAHQRGSAEVTLGDLLARFVAAVWNRHPLAGSAPASALAYRRPLANGAGGTPLTVHVPDAHQASLQAIAAARLGAGDAAGDAADGEGSGSEPPAAIALVDLTDSRLDRSSGRVSGALVTVVAGRLQPRVVAVEGAPTVRDTLPLTLAFDGGRVGLDEAAAFADRLVGLIETPSDLLILY